jgi:hypothetical protein
VKLSVWTITSSPSRTLQSARCSYIRSASSIAASPSWLGTGAAFGGIGLAPLDRSASAEHHTTGAADHDTIRALLFALGGAPGAPAGTNVIANPGFETGNFAGWGWGGQPCADVLDPAAVLGSSR